MATQRMTVKSSTVFVSVDKETRVFRSVDEVPPEWRKRFERPRGGLKPQTILIADRKGREEIMRSLQGRPSAVQTRWNSAGGAPSAITGALPVLPSEGEGPEDAQMLHASVFEEPAWSMRRIVLEGILVLGVAAALFYSFLS